MAGSFGQITGCLRATDLDKDMTDRKQRLQELATMLGVSEEDLRGRAKPGSRHRSFLQAVEMSDAFARVQDAATRQHCISYVQALGQAQR